MAQGLRPRLPRSRAGAHKRSLRWPSPLFEHIKEIASFAAEQRLPSTYGFREFCDSGGLLCYGSNLRLQFGRLGYFINKILKGTKAGNIPIEEPTKLELIVNAKVAKSLDITLPTSILISADELIE